MYTPEYMPVRRLPVRSSIYLNTGLQTAILYNKFKSGLTVLVLVRVENPYFLKYFALLQFEIGWLVGWLVGWLCCVGWLQVTHTV